MKNISLKIKNIVNKYKSYIFNVLLAIFLYFCLVKLSIFIYKLIPDNKVLQQMMFTLIVIVYIVASVVIMSSIDKIKNLIHKIKTYNMNGKKCKKYIYADINEYPEVNVFKSSIFFKYNTIEIVDKFLDTGIKIVDIIKKYFPESDDELLSVLSYINGNYNKRINKNNYNIISNIGTKQGIMHKKFENQDTILFLTISQVYGYGNIERTYETQQIYDIMTNNNDLLHEIKALHLSSIFLYDEPLPWDPEYIENDDEESDDLYKLKYDTIEEVFAELDNGNEIWKEYVLNFFNEFDKLSDDKAKKFLKLTDYEVPTYWYDILMNKKYLEYTKKYK